MKRYYIIRMNDLKEKVQEEIVKDLKEYSDKKIQKAMDKAWVELEVEL